MKLMMQSQGGAGGLTARETVQPQNLKPVSQMQQQLDYNVKTASVFGSTAENNSNNLNFGQVMSGGSILESKKPGLQWPVVESLLQKQMFDEAFMMILRQV